ncbi:MAG: zinc ribbon domain-containing protein [Desulforhopalus sp.]
MPIYEYKCSECGNIFEVLTTSSKDTEKAQCDKCKSDKVKKVISAGSFRLTSGISSAPPAGCGGKSGFS